MPTTEITVQYCSEVNDLPTVDNFSEWAACVQALVGESLKGEHDEREIVVRIVDSEEMQTLNASWRDRDYATNVLAFPFQGEISAPHIPLGDIVICAPIVAIQAHDQEKPFVDKMAHMFVHGLLHLLGYDHQSTEQAEAMENIEHEALSRLGYAKPYEND